MTFMQNKDSILLTSSTVIGKTTRLKKTKRKFQKPLSFLKVKTDNIDRFMQI